MRGPSAQHLAWTRVRHRGDVFKFAGKAMVGDKVAAECEFAAMVVET